jgi:hypothetical protein
LKELRTFFEIFEPNEEIVLFVVPVVKFSGHCIRRSYFRQRKRLDETGKM